MGKQPEDGALILASELEKHAEVLPGRVLILANESEEHVQILPGNDYSSSISNDEKCKEPGRPIKTAVRPREIKAAAAVLWRQRLTLGVIVAVATILIWFLSETLAYCLLGYYLLEHICTMFFVWSEPSVFINRQPPHIPRISFSNLCRDVALALIFEIDRLFAFPVIVDDASGRDWKKFLMVVTGLWFLSVACRWDAFLSLFYYVLHVFRKIMRAVISSPGFNESVNDFFDFLLALATSSIQPLQHAMFIPVLRRLTLIWMKRQGKKALVWLLVWTGENSNNAKAFVDLYVTDTV